MANIPYNAYASLVKDNGSITGSFGGFTAISQSVFTGLRDGSGGAVISNTTIIVAAGTTVPLFTTSASISSGAVLFYP
jgi:hypothetical protein